MKKKIVFMGLLAVCAALFLSCDKNPTNKTQEIASPNAKSLKNLRTEALKEITQNFTVEVIENKNIEFTSANGVKFEMMPYCLQKGTEAVKVGSKIDIEFVEIYDRSEMILTNKPTMGRDANGDVSLLVTGGEFYVNMKQDGVQLKQTCSFTMQVPDKLSGGTNPNMTLWKGEITEEDNLIWDQVTANDGPANDGPEGGGGIWFNKDSSYGLWSEVGFGWINIDALYNQENFTEIEVVLPKDYNLENSSVYLTIEGEVNTVYQYYKKSKLPKDLKVNVVLISESEGKWVYAIKAAVIEKDLVVTFTKEELKVTNKEGLAAVLKALK